METTKNATLEQKVANYKVVARDALRMELISPRLSKITAIENEIKSVNECKANYEHEVLVQSYEISKLDKDHPDYEATKKNKEEIVVDCTASIKEHSDRVIDLEKEIAEQKEGIAKIESGETKVCLEDLNALVAQMIEQDALNQVK